MPFNIERTLIIMELILQDVLQTNFLIPLYPTTFREIAFALPHPSGISGLPSHIYFDIDNRFTAAQEQRIKDGINAILFHWYTHMTEKWNGGTNNGVSQLAACVNPYATKNLRPTWYNGPPILNGLTATNVAMDQFTQLFKDNGFRRAPRARIFSSIPSPPNSSYIVGLTAFKQNQVSLSVLINPLALDQTSYNIVLLSGSLMHAWLHRAGFLDPKTTSYFISECPMCVMRGYQVKVDSLPDSVNYQFFD